MDVYHTSTHGVALVRNLGCMSEMCCSRLAENAVCKNDAKKSPSQRHRTTLWDRIFATKAYIDNRKKLVKQQYLLHMVSQYGEFRPTNRRDRLASLGHPGKFQRVSRLGFDTAPAWLNGGQPNFARCLTVSTVGYIHFRGLLPLTEF